MNRLHFSIDIKAEKSTIWNALWNDSSYRDWASVFEEGTYVVTDNWTEGSTVQFLASGQSGIYSLIESHVPSEIMKFRHIGSVVNGENQPLDEKAKAWSGATESYTLTEGASGNTLSIDIDVLDEHLDFMKERLPMALERVKRNCG